MNAVVFRRGHALVDTSVIVASLDPDEPNHLACDRMLAAGQHKLYVHVLAETFSVLTGGRLGRRVAPSLAAGLLRNSVLPHVKLASLSGQDVTKALARPGDPLIECP